MTAEQEIRNQIAKNITERWKGDIDEQDAIEDFRCSGQISGINRGKFSRHYECDEVAIVLDNGKAVGWTYWHGGGKHAEPSAIDWIEDAYFVDVKQETRIVNVYSKKEI